QVAVHGLRGLVVRLGQLVLAGLRLLVLLLLLERSDDCFDPFQCHVGLFSGRVLLRGVVSEGQGVVSERSWSIRSVRKVQVAQKSTSSCWPCVFRVNTLRGGPFSLGTFSTSTSPFCSMRTRSAYTVPSAISSKPRSRRWVVISYPYAGLPDRSASKMTSSVPLSISVICLPIASSSRYSVTLTTGT